MVPVTIDGRRYRSLSEAYREHDVATVSGISYKTFRYRILAGWKPEHAAYLHALPPVARRNTVGDLDRATRCMSQRKNGRQLEYLVRELNIKQNGPEQMFDEVDGYPVPNDGHYYVDVINVYVPREGMQKHYSVCRQNGNGGGEPLFSFRPIDAANTKLTQILYGRAR